MDCPCEALDDALTALDRLTQTTELLSLRVDRLVQQARRAGLILPDSLMGDDLYGPSDLAAAMGISRARWYQLAADPTFPLPVLPGRYRAGAVLAWRKVQLARWNGGRKPDR